MLSAHWRGVEQVASHYAHRRGITLTVAPEELFLPDNLLEALWTRSLNRR